VASVSRIDKVQVSFAKESYERDYILQMRAVISSILIIVATPYVLPYGSLSNVCHFKPIAVSTTHIYIHIHVCQKQRVDSSEGSWRERDTEW